MLSVLQRVVVVVVNSLFCGKFVVFWQEKRIYLELLLLGGVGGCPFVVLCGAMVVAVGAKVVVLT